MATNDCISKDYAQKKNKNKTIKMSKNCLFP